MIDSIKWRLIRKRSGLKAKSYTKGLTFSVAFLRHDIAITVYELYYEVYYSW